MIINKKVCMSIHKYLKQKFIISCIASIFCLFIQTTYADIHAKIYYDVHHIGTQKSDSSIAYSINDLDQVCGTYNFDGQTYVFIWDKIKGLNILNDFPSSCIPKKINNLGQIAGNYTLASGEHHGFFWDSRIGFIDIGTLGGKNAWVNDLNDLGQIVGGSETGKISDLDHSLIQHAFIWEYNSIQDLGALKDDSGIEGDKSYAVAINNKGDTVGLSNYLLVSKGKTVRSKERPFIWKGDSIVELVPEEARASTILVHDINDSGDAVVAVFPANDSPRYYYKNIVTSIMRDVSNWAHPTTLLNNGTGWYIDGARAGCIQPGMQIWQALTISTTKENGDYSITKLHSVNKKGNLVGVAKNIYGDEHAVLLRPFKITNKK